MGGNNSSDNLELLTLEEHTLAHKKLYEQYGKLQDKIAWLMLSGKTIEGEQLRKILSKNALKEKLLDVPDRKLKWAAKISKTLTGRTLSDKHKTNISKGLQKALKEGRKTYVKPGIDYLRSNYVKNKNKMISSRLNSKLWKQKTWSEEANQKRSNTLKGRVITWGDNISSKKQGAATASTIEIIVNGVLFVSIAQAARNLNLPDYKLRTLYRKHGKNIILR